MSIEAAFRPLLLAAVLALLPGMVLADQKSELLELKHTIHNLMDALVEQGVVSAEQAESVKRTAAEKARAQTRAEQAQDQPEQPPPGKVIRVPYVPQFVKDEIRDQVRSELRGEVVEDVLRQAKTERWGMPEALPDWTRRFSFEGDLRLRGQGEFYAGDNARFATAYVDFARANANKSISGAFLNTEEDRERARMRLRLGVKAKVTNDLDAGIRLATGSKGSAVSTNQTLDGNFGSYEIVLDRAYLKYTGRDLDGYPWLTLSGGRIANPYFSTDLLWDSDLNFDGAAATLRYNLSGGDDLFALEERDKSLFATFGLFSIDEVELSDADKWLFGAQLGADLLFEDQSRLKLALAYYDYNNIEGRRSPVAAPNRNDYTAPGALQKGNSLFDISNVPGNPFQRFGLASDFNILNLTAQYDIARFAPIHVVVTADYVENLGYDADAIRNRLDNGAMFVNSTVFSAPPEDAQTRGYHAKVSVGWPDVLARDNWQVSLGYKYLERDAVVDAFTDSDFLLGGTNAKGWILGASYGVLDNTYVSARYLSADVISGPPLGIDVLQLDLVTEF